MAAIPRRRQTPAISGERKKFGLRHARSPIRHGSLSGVVVVRDSLGIGTCNIAFEEDLVRALGKHMPRGVSPIYPAYLRVVNPLDGSWEIYCKYLREQDILLMWVEDSIPAWIKGISRFSKI